MPLRSLILTALFAALTAVGAFLRVPVGDTSFTLQVLFTCMAGVLLGLALLLTGAELPALASDFLSTAGAASTPLIMFIIGAQLGELRLGEALRDRRIYVFCALKLLLIPAASCLAIRLGIGDGGLTGLVSVLLTAMPAPSCAALFSRQYGGDYPLATRCVLVSTLLSAVTIPLWIALIWR